MRMVSAASLGTVPSEEQLLDCMPRNDNPNLGFRGDPAARSRFQDGSINWNNYGAYAPAVANALNQCVFGPAGGKFEAVASNNVNYEQVAEAVLDGYPVIVWVARRGQPSTTLIDTAEGSVRLVHGEHVWVVIGCHEDGTFDAHDPYPQKDGDQTFHARSFPNWGLFDHMAVFVVPREVDRR